MGDQLEVMSGLLDTGADTFIWWCWLLEQLAIVC